MDEAFKLLAPALPKVIDVPGDIDARGRMSLGAAFAGMIGLGLVSSPAELSALPREEVTYVPGRPAAEVAALLKGWHRAVQQVTLVS